MKKNVEEPGIEASLAKRKELESSIQGVINQLGRFANLQQLLIACGDSRTRAESFLNNHGKGVETNIPASRQGEYLRLKEDAESKRVAYVSAKQKDEALRKELADLKTDLDTLGRQAEAADVKKCQDEVDRIENRIEELKQATILELDKITLSKVTRDTITSLYREREDIMADIAIGATGNESRLAEIETQIPEEEARISEAKKVESSAKATIAGLERKIAEAEQSLAAAKATLQIVYCDFLISEAEKTGAKFAEIAAEMWGQFSRLIALGTMIEKHPSAKGVWLISGDCLRFKIPSFNLKSCLAGHSGTGGLHDCAQLDISAEIDSVKRDFATIGIK